MTCETLSKRQGESVREGRTISPVTKTRVLSVIKIKGSVISVIRD